MDMMNNLASQTTEYGTGIKNSVGGLMLETTHKLVDSGQSLMDGIVNVASTIPKTIFNMKREAIGSVANLLNLPSSALKHSSDHKKCCLSFSNGINGKQSQMQMPSRSQMILGQSQLMPDQPQMMSNQPSQNVYGRLKNIYDQPQDTVQYQQQPRTSMQYYSSQNMGFTPEVQNPVNHPQPIKRYGTISGLNAPKP